MPACVQDDYLPSTDLPRPRRRIAARARRLPTDRCRDGLPAAGYFGADEFTYTIQDPDGLTDTASVFVTVDNIDDSVVAYDDWAYAPMNGTGHLIDVLENDDDPDGDTLNITLPGQGQGGYPAHGAITVVAGSPEQVCYTPAAEYFGYDEFTYTVDDGHGNSDTATVSVIVYKLTVNVSPGYCVPGVSPARWAVPVGDQYYGTVVTLVVDTLPESIPLYDMTIAWTGATVDLDNSVYAYHDRTVTGAYNVEVLVTDEDDESIDADTELVVVGIDRIVSDDANLLEAETGNSDNAVTGVSSDPASVTVKVLVTPSTPDVSPVYNQLIVWGGSRGSVGITPDRYGLPRDYPARLPVQARIGASSDTLDVWAVQVNVRVGGLTEEQEELDANAVSVSVNSDDNNQSGVPDVNESNDVLGLGVTGEDDLVPVGIGIEPNGVPVGELALVLPAGDHFAACANDDKAGGRLNPASWSLDAEQPPCGFALEGVSLTGPQSLLLQYSLGSTMVSEDSAKIKCVSHPASFGGMTPGAYLRMYTTRSIGGGGGEAGTESVGSGVSAQSIGAYSAPTRAVVRGELVGGQVKETLIVKLPANSYVQADAAHIQFTRDYDPENIKMLLPVHFNGGPWYIVTNRTPDEWDLFYDAAQQTSNIGRPYSEPGSYTPRNYELTLASPLLTLFTINMPVPQNLPFNSANDHHHVSLHDIVWDWDPDGGDWTETEERTLLPIAVSGVRYENGPLPDPYDSSNVVITKVKTSAGNEDYLCYDPDPESRPDHHRPSINFTIEDRGDPNDEYQYFIFLQPTGASGFQKLVKEGAYAWMVGEHGTGTVTATWKGWRGVPQGDPEEAKDGDWWIDKADWGTYTFDVGVISPDGDWFYYKWPYCLHIEKDEHDVWVNQNYNDIIITEDPDSGQAINEKMNMLIGKELRFNYILRDYALNYLNHEDANYLKAIVVDNDLKSYPCQGAIENAVRLNVLNNGDGDGILAYQHDGKIYGWRVLLIAEDACWINYRRDHMPSKMLAVNETYPDKIKKWTKSEISKLQTILWAIIEGMDKPVIMSYQTMTYTGKGGKTYKIHLYLNRDNLIDAYSHITDNKFTTRRLFRVEEHPAFPTAAGFTDYKKLDGNKYSKVTVNNSWYIAITDQGASHNCDYVALTLIHEFLHVYDGHYTAKYRKTHDNQYVVTYDNQFHGNNGRSEPLTYLVQDEFYILSLDKHLSTKAARGDKCIFIDPTKLVKDLLSDYTKIKGAKFN